MKPVLPRLDLWKTLARTATAATLCVLLAEQPLLAEAAALPKSPVRASQEQLQGDARILHALNRLTFGPRPGDVAAVQAMGLNRWLDAQLNPGTIDDAALDRRLDNFPAMKLSQEALMRRFPSPLVLKTMEKQNLPLPSDPVEHAIYADQMAFYTMQQQKKAAKGAEDAAMKAGDDPAMADKQMADKKMGKGDDGIAGSMKTALPGDMMDPATPAMAAHVEALYSGLDAVKIINLPPNERMQRILAMSPKELIAFRQSLSQRELAEASQGLSPQQKEILAALPGSLRLVGGEILETRLLRDIYSDRQLEAVMTDFWLNHFNVYIRKNQNEPYLLPSYESQTIRPRALGKFEDLLVATAESPAMMMYLDNWQSIGPESEAADRSKRQLIRNPNAKGRPSGLNENYARELMELHTLGVGGGYTQADVTQVAKVFTGWTIERPYRGADFQFDGLRHEPGTKHVLGVDIHESGQKEGLQVLHMLATSPATAKFVSTKLAVRFVADDPPAALVDRMTKSFLASGGDIKTVLRTMFDAPEFWTPSVYRAKVKTPLEFVVSAARASDAQIVNALPLVQSLDKLGMPLYGMQTPNGYSWLAEPWVSTGALVSRMNFALVLTADRVPGVRTGLDALLATPAGGAKPVGLTTAGVDPATVEKEARLERLLLGEPASDRTRATVLHQFQDTAAQQQAEKDFAIKDSNPEQMADMVGNRRLSAVVEPQAAPIRPQDRQTSMMAGLLLGSPEFQRR